jgi:hypothetical protein
VADLLCAALQEVEEKHGVGIYCGVLRFAWKLTQEFP